MVNVYLLLGSNLNDRELFLKQAIDLISVKVGKVTKTSKVYETAAWGNTDQGAFLNQVILLQTPLSPAKVLKKIHKIESHIGRIRQNKWEPRTIDIDILFYDSLVIQSEDLIIPHPELPNRRFALTPLNELAPEFIHPVYQLKISEMLEKCPDKLAVNVYESDKKKQVSRD